MTYEQRVARMAEALYNMEQTEREHRGNPWFLWDNCPKREQIQWRRKAERLMRRYTVIDRDASRRR